MKQYFVKLIPVKGKIKKGDLIICSNSPGTNVTHKDWQMAQGHSCCKKAKLFLCSRDIQVGDKNVYDRFLQKENLTAIKIDPFRIVPKYMILRDSNGNTYSQENSIRGFLFKAVGEISSDATWIKEGDEFDEDEVKPVVMVMNYTTPFEYGKYENFEDIKKMYKGAVVIVKIKCSNCNIFH